jgi:hypothetical protein
MAIINQPRLQILNGVSFSDAEVAVIAEGFAGQSSVVVGKETIRETPEVQKALFAAACLSVDINSGDEATLYLTADGIQLLGLPLATPVPPPPSILTLTDDQIAYLQTLFPTMDLIVWTPAQVRTDEIVQQALYARVLVTQTISPGNPTVSVLLTQAGRALLGKT